VNHPDKRKSLKRGEVKVAASDAENVHVVEHRLFHPYFLKFKFNWLYNVLTFLHIRKIVETVGHDPDIIWTFDTGNSLPTKYFSKSALKIYMPVDGPFGHQFETKAADDADVIISVTNRLLQTFEKVSKPKFLVNHGVADSFICGSGTTTRNGQDKIRVGYSGSLIRNDLDIECFLKLIKSHPDKIFEFWGEINHRTSNIHLPQDVGEDTLRFIETLKSLPNVILHGSVTSSVLAEGLKNMDVLLICYSIKNDHNNHHKVLEYLGSGKVIVSGYMSPYASSNLVEMATNPENNDEIQGIFKRVVENLDYFNSSEMCAKRRNFAREYSYTNNILKIEQFINKSRQNSRLAHVQV
jgi:hypothetical protein